VAIIGMACRFPGARDPAEFHDLSAAGRSMFQLAAGLPGRPLRAALLDDWPVPQIPADDPLFGDLELGPQDLGPVQKLAAEMTALALTDAGLREAAGTSRTGLIIASSTPGLCELVREELGFARRGPYPGPAQVSSLHAVAAAADALQAGDLDLAVAGGASLGLDPVWLALQARAGTLGSDEMRVYAADPAGLLPGDGCGMIVLVRTEDARTAGVPVYAEIAGWTGVPASAPELAGLALLQAYQRAGVDPADIQLIEGQGTGTAAADSAELAALTQLRQGGRAVAALGAVSAGIGYTRAAAGIASLIKVAVAMAAGTIPPGPSCAQPHPLVASGDGLLRLPAQPEPWPDDSRGIRGAPPPRFAAVNSLGTADPAMMPGHFGLREAEGIHLVLRREGEADRWAGRRRRAGEGAGPRPGVPGSAVDTAERRHVFVLRGGEPGALASQLDVIAASAAVLSDAGLDGLARQLAIGALEAGDHPAPLRVALTAATPRQLAARAQCAARLLRANGPAAATAGPPDVRISAGVAGAVVVLFPGRAESAADQPTLFAASLQALDTLDLLGVRPIAGVGYGLAEITGLTWAGSISAAEGARLLAQCGQVLQACAGGPAAMARVTADGEVARALAAPGRLYLAAYEGPRTHVLAGSTAGIRDMARRAAVLGVPVEVLDGAHGGHGSRPMHSPAMARCTAPLRCVFAGTSFAPPQRRLFSTITGRLITPQDDIARLLAGQVSRPVLFAQAMAQACEVADLIVTAGAEAGLTAKAAECGGIPAVAMPTSPPAGRGVRAGADLSTLAEAIAALFAAGAVTDLTPFLAPARPAVSGGTLASKTIPRMRAAEPPALGRPPAPAASEAGSGANGRTPARSAN